MAFTLEALNKADGIVMHMQETPVEATHWGRWARQLPLSSAVPVLVAPPLIGGAVVGGLRALTSFDDKAMPKQEEELHAGLRKPLAELVIAAHSF